MVGSGVKDDLLLFLLNQRMRSPTLVLLILCFLSPSCLVLNLIRFVPPVLAQTVDARKAQADKLRQSAEQSLQFGMYFVAQNQLQQALQLYRKLGDRTATQDTLINLTVAYTHQGNYIQAQTVLQEAKSISTRNAKLWSTEGLIFLESGDYWRAETAFNQAKSFVNQDLAERYRIDIGLGETYRYLGRYSLASAILELATRQSGDRRDRGRAFNALGDLQVDLGQYSQALERYQRALAERRAIGDQPGIAQSLSSLGCVYRELRQYSDALQSFQDALALMRRQMPDRTTEMFVLNDLGQTYALMGKPQLALEHFQQALKVAQGEITTTYVQTLINMGRYYRKQGQPTQAIATYQQAIGLAKRIGDRASTGKAFVGLGKTYLQTNQLPKAADALKEGVGILELLRVGLRDQQKVSLFETQAVAYQTLQKVLVKQGRYEQALIVAEQGRARAFAELLLSRLASSPVSEQDAKPLSVIPQIQAVARLSRATIVEYSILSDDEGQESELFIWVIKPTGEIFFQQVNLQALQGNLRSTIGTVAKGARLEAATGRQQLLTHLVGTTRGVITDRTSLETTSTPSELPILKAAYEILIQPIADYLPKSANERVVLIPQGSLFLIPFQALQTSTGEYLIQKHALAIAPSIQVLSLTQRRRRQPSTAKVALVVGNPEPMPDNLSPLPGAEAEAKQIAQLLKTKALVGRNATETVVVEQMQQAQLIHLATHGLYDDQQGLQSALMFAASGNLNGQLTAEEIFNLPLKADLAVLSACNTGRGQITGDGVVGLSRSFIAAGVPSVLVSLWYVPDAPTASLMLEFYRNLQQSGDKIRALQQAMLTTIKQNSNPRDWAAFTLVGSPD
jgi:CHAT domain-containing protein/tetratricopeptide (TPR) repeat protein